VKAKRRDENRLVAARRSAPGGNPKLPGQEPSAAGRQVAARILESVDRLAGYPHIGPSGRAIGTRELVVSGTPYVIPYRVTEDRLQLIAVFSRQMGEAD